MRGFPVLLDKNLTKNHKTHLIKNSLGFFKPLGNFDVSFSRSRLIPAIFLFFYKNMCPFKLNDELKLSGFLSEKIIPPKQVYWKCDKASSYC